MAIIVAMHARCQRSVDIVADYTGLMVLVVSPKIPVNDPKPVPPAEPDPADCCGEGCVPCVYDRYDEERERYKADLAAWQARHPGE